MLLDSPTVHVISPGEHYWDILRELITQTKAQGNDIYDVSVVAVCLEHGARTILTEDKGFRRFRDIAIEPLNK